MPFDSFDRPSWDEYFMALAFFISQRSIDPETKHGCIVVDNEHTILATGYNSPPKGCVDSEIPLTRPEKYFFLVHSEEAAIINAARVGVSLRHSVFYITGYPCIQCLRKIISVGATKIVYGPIVSHCITEEEKKHEITMLKGQNILIERFIKFQDFTKLIEQTYFYVKDKFKVVGS